MTFLFHGEEKPALSTSKAGLAGLDSNNWDRLFSSSAIHTYPASTELFHQGSIAREIYCIENGLVKLFCLGQGGQELIIGLRSSGGILGASPVVLQKVHLITATTLTRCRMYQVSAESFLEYLKTDPQLSWHIHQKNSKEHYEQTIHLIGLGSLSARHRLEQVLWQMACAETSRQPQKQIRLRLPLKQWELAELLAVTPAYVSRLFNEMEHDGVLRRERGALIIFNTEALWHHENF